MFLKSPIHFSQSWEDHKVIEEGLAIKKDYHIVGISASGDNLLNFLRFEPAKIYGFDTNPNQIYEMKLKITAIKHLKYQKFITLMGYTGTEIERIEIFNSIKNLLDSDSLIFWEKNLKIILKGLLFQGKIEKYYTFLRHLLKFILGNYYNQYLNTTSREERETIYNKRINKKFLKIVTKLVQKNRAVINIVHYKKRINDGNLLVDYNKFLWEKIYRSIVEIGCQQNPYLYWCFTGRIPDDQELWRPYLQEKNYDIIKRNLHKITIYKSDLYKGLKEIKDNSIDAIYLSDILDWIKKEDIEKYYQEILRVAKDKAKVINFVLNFDKPLPSKYQEHIIYNEEKSKTLFCQERTGLYSKIYLYEINK
jgi:S-adenosylmethionine:diacylglycerol 3-amino-3-carboxypropyl transferase